MNVYVDEYINTFMFNDDPNSNYFNATSYETFKGIIQRRFIYSIISICFCLFIVIAYIILCIQVYLIKKKQRELSYLEETASNSSEIKEKVGLANHFMFSVIVSNILASIVPIVFYVVTYNFNFDEEGLEERLLKFDNRCSILGFLHNYLDLVSVCWISALMNLFYKSTTINEFKKGEEAKQYIFGFLYSMFAPLVVTIPPFFINKNIYGYADSYCSLNYHSKAQFLLNKVELFKILITSFLMLNLIINVYQLIKVTIHYRKRLKILKQQQNKEYKVISLYVFIFICFPIHLIITRFFKSLNRYIDNMVTTSFGADMLVPEMSSFISCTNGCITSLLCCYFFRNVYTCKIWKKSNLDGVSKEIAMTESLMQSFDEGI